MRSNQLSYLAIYLEGSGAKASTSSHSLRKQCKGTTYFLFLQHLKENSRPKEKAFPLLLSQLLQSMENRSLFYPGEKGLHTGEGNPQPEAKKG
jgi:hypothetical protein